MERQTRRLDKISDLDTLITLLQVAGILLTPTQETFERGFTKEELFCEAKTLLDPEEQVDELDLERVLSLVLLQGRANMIEKEGRICLT